MIVKPGEGRSFTIGPQVATVKLDSAGPAMVETLLPPGSGAPRHLHWDHDETFYVVAGALDVEVEGERAVLGPGGVAHATRGQAHRFLNPGPGDAIVLALYDPAPAVAYLEELGAAVELPDDERANAIEALYERFATEPA